MPEQTAKVAVVIPYRPAQGREDHYNYTRRWYEKWLSNALIITADTGSDDFNRGGSRNQGVEDAARLGYDVVVLADADTIPEIEPLRAAIAECEDGRMHLPFNYFRGLTKHSTKKFKRGFNPTHLDTEDETSWSTGGVVVMTVDSYQRTGGQPELTGWGFEDTIFRVICDAILGETKRHQGTIYHLWHPKVWNLGSEQYNANAAVAAEYNEAEGDPEAVMRLIQRRYDSTQEVSQNDNEGRDSEA